MQQVFALVDCNNFYASCEKLFRPDLKHKPVVVLSNNDGCIIARSKEAKVLGVKMGAPFYQVADFIRQHKIEVFSSNYALYGDISARVAATLEALTPRIEQYSIDECFVDMTGVHSAMSLEAFGIQIKQIIKQHIGIDVCVGIAPTKTLAKLANHAAKQYPATGGVVDLTNPLRQTRLLKLMPIDEVWGVGRRLKTHLELMGMKTAFDLASAHPAMIKKQFSVVLERTVRELNGVSCIDLEESAPTKQQIICSRSFGQRITEYAQMHQAITQYMTRAGEKLRMEKRLAQGVSLFMRTNPHNKEEPQYRPTAFHRLDVPTEDTRDLVDVGTRLLKSIWRDGYRYMKAGVMLSEFSQERGYQPGLFDKQSRHQNSKAVMQVLDAINQSGKGRVYLAAQGTEQDWSMQRKQLSPAYTTCWEELPRIR